MRQMVGELRKEVDELRVQLAKAGVSTNRAGWTARRSGLSTSISSSSMNRTDEKRATSTKGKAIHSCGDLPSEISFFSQTRTRSGRRRLIIHPRTVSIITTTAVAAQCRPRQSRFPKPTSEDSVQPRPYSLCRQQIRQCSCTTLTMLVACDDFLDSLRYRSTGGHTIITPTLSRVFRLPQ